MIISTRGKKLEFFEFDEFENFLKENNYIYEKEDAISFFSNNKIKIIQKSKLPFKINKKQEKNITNKKNKVDILLSGCSEDCIQKFKEYIKKVELEIKSFQNPPQRFLPKTLYYVYLKDYNYYALIIQDNFNYFKNFNYKIIDKKVGCLFDLFYIKFSLLKNYFEYRKILNIDGMYHFEGFSKKIIELLPDKPIMKINILEQYK